MIRMLSIYGREHAHKEGDYDIHPHAVLREKAVLA
jgi:hypothetical protein